MAIEKQAGWEDYYVNSNGCAWKEDVEEFLTDNINDIPKILDKTFQEVSVLDIGCGDGRNSFIWLDHRVKLSCLDLSKTALGVIEKKCIERRLEVPKLIVDDFLKNDLGGETFDIVQSFDALAQIEDTKEAIGKIIALAKPNGLILLNYFTQNDCAYGEGKKVDNNTYVYKNTLFKFMNEEELRKALPSNIKVLKMETIAWDDPPHGEFRPCDHKHEAVFVIGQKI